MLGEGYMSYQFYSYKNLEDLENILEKTNANNYIIHEEQEVIEYIIDRKTTIRLSDLIYWIQEGLIKIYVGQLLDLFEKILNYQSFLEQEQIQHNYLDLNRIWIELQSGSQYLSIVHVFLNYQIFFTGYQCPFYENLTQEVPQLQSQVLKQILIDFKQNKVWLVKDKENRKEVAKIYEFLINKLNQNSLEISLQGIKKVKQTYNYLSVSQNIALDQKTTDSLVKIFRIQEFKEELKNLFNSLNGQNQIVLERTLYFLVPKYRKYISKLSLFSSFPKVNQADLINFKEKINQEEQLWFNEIEQLILNMIKNQNETNQDQKYEFQLNENQIKEIQSEIIRELSKKLIFKYFENSIWYQTDELSLSKDHLSIQILYVQIQEMYRKEEQLKIQEQISDLI